MSLTVESGSGLAAAEAYVSVADCLDYHTKRGTLAAWTAVLDQEAALRKATQYLDAAYAWKGVKTTLLQALKWPRANITIDGYPILWNVLPMQLVQACCELAIRPSLFVDESAQYVTDVTVGAIKRTMSAQQNGGQTRFAVVDALVRDLVKGGSGSSMVSVVRA